MNKFTCAHAMGLACGLLSLSPAFAQNALEEVVVTSSRVAMPLRDVGTSISILTRDELLQRGFTSLQDALRTQPSVSVRNTGGPGKAAALRIRGEEGYRTLVLLDGIDISDTSGPQVAPRMEQLVSAGIQRVEILRGPQGLMYGADAGGVINISTLPAVDGFGGELSAEAGRYGTHQYTGYLGAAGGGADLSLMGSQLRTDGFNARTADASGERDGYDNSTLHGRLGYRVSDTLKLQMTLRDVRGDNSFDSCFRPDTFAQTNDCADDFHQRAGRVAADYAGDSVTHQFAYSRSETDRDFFSAGQTSFATQGELARITYLGSWHGGEALRLVYGVDLENASIDDGGTSRDRDQNGYYAEYQGRLAGAIHVTAGVRYDDNDDFGSHTSYRVSGAHVLALGQGELKLRGAYGTGFRAPSLYEVAYNQGPFSTAPAAGTALREERSAGFDIGASWSTARGVYTELTLFDQRIEDEIVFDLANFSGYLQSAGESRSRGVELAATLPLPQGLLLRGNYTYTDSAAPNGGARPFRPQQLANIGVLWRAANARLTLGISARAARGARDSAGTRLDDYALVDVNGTFAVAGGLTLYGRLENALDENYAEVPGYFTAGRAAYAGVRYAF